MVPFIFWNKSSQKPEIFPDDLEVQSIKVEVIIRILFSIILSILIILQQFSGKQSSLLLFDEYLFCAFVLQRHNEDYNQEDDTVLMPRIRLLVLLIIFDD